MSEQNQRANTVVIGAGPAGLTAAYELGKRDHKAVVLEADDVVGGILARRESATGDSTSAGTASSPRSRRCGSCGTKFLPTKISFCVRYESHLLCGRFYDYPLRAFNALRNLGVLEAVRCVLSYLWVRIRPPKDLTTFEGYIASKFGWRLYGIFFKTYTEKCGAFPPIRSKPTGRLSGSRTSTCSGRSSILGTATNQKEITSLIEEFEYPRHGPG